MHLLALSLTLLFQSLPAARPAPVELKPFGDEQVAQPRLAAVPGAGSTKDNPTKSLILPPWTPGALHIIGQRGLEVLYASSNDEGKSFSEPKVLVTVKQGAAMRRGPRIAVYGDNVVVTAPEGGDVNERRILSVASQDGGKSWSALTEVTDKPGVAAECFHDLAVTTSGIFVVTWLDLREGKGQSIYCSHSMDGGKTWSKNSKVYSSPDGSVCQCCPVAITSGSGNRIAICFRNAIGGSRDLYLASSLDAGETFDKIEPVSGETWKLNACPMAEAGLALCDEFGKNRDQPIIINNRDGQLAYVHKSGEISLGSGRRPAAQFCDGDLFIAFIRVPDAQLVVEFALADIGPRELKIPVREEGQRADSPALSRDAHGCAWLAYEVRMKDKTSTRLLQLSSRDSGILWPIRTH